jgi:hypothetical protein
MLFHRNIKVQAAKFLTILISLALLFSTPVFSFGPSNPTYSLAQTGSYSRVDNQYIYAGNNKIELVFQKSDGRLYSIIDKASGCDFLGSKNAYWSLFNFWVDVTAARDYPSGGNANSFGYTLTYTQTGVTINMSWEQFRTSRPAPLNMRVRVSIDIPNGSALTYWRISISNSEDLAIKGVAFPNLNGISQLSRDGAGDYLAFPSMSGLLFQNPVNNFKLNGGWGWEMFYPSAFATMQFMAYYSTELRTGLYMAAYDPDGYCKSLNVSKPAQDWLSLDVFHIPLYTKHADYMPDYPVVVGVFSGDWYDAAQIYRDWALQQSWATGARMAGSGGALDWYDNLALHEWIYTYPLCYDVNHFSIVPDIAQDTSQFVGAPVAMDWIGWERRGWYIDYPDVFPPKEGWASFEAAVRNVREQGNHVWVVPDATSYSSRLESWSEAEPYAVVNESGEIPSPYSYDECGLTTKLIAMCPATSYWQNRLRQLLLPLAEKNVDVIQLDGFPVMAPKICTRADHNHPPGGGNWWFQAYKQILEGIKKDARRFNPSIAFSSEGMAEPYLKITDSVWDPFTTGWSPQSVEPVFANAAQVGLIPLWHAVYHDYALIQSGISFSNRNAPSGAEGYGSYRDYYVRGFGLALIWGEIPTTWYGDERLSELNEPEEQEMAEYLKRIVNARRTYAAPFLVGGRMLRPPDIKVPGFQIAGAKRIPYTSSDFPSFTSPSVLSSLWKASSGDAGYILTNISHSPVTFDLSIDAAAVEFNGLGRYQIAQFRNESYGLIDASTSLPFKTSISIAPLEVVVITVKETITTARRMTIPGGGAAATSTVGSIDQMQVGYASVDINSGNPPYGTAVISFTQNDVVVTEAGIPASPPTTSARIFIDYRTGVNAVPGRSDAGTISINTGIAIVNSSSTTAHITYTLRSTTGNTIATGHGELAGGNHVACFIDHLKEDAAPDFNLPADFQTAVQFGSLEISSDQSVSVLALRGTTNQRNEFLITTTPIADLMQPLSNSPIYFPQFVDGGGYTTSVILMNTSSILQTGSLVIRDKNGAPFAMQQVGGTINSTFRYSIQPGGLFRFQTDGLPADTKAGWVRLDPDAGTSTPIGSGVFGYNPGSILVSESGIPSAVSTTHARVYVDLSGNHNTGLAIANVTGADASIMINAFQSDGNTGIGTSQGPLPLAASGYKAAFADEFVTGLPAGFKGVLDISSSTPFAALTLRSLINERDEFLMTTFPVADANQSGPTPVVFPQIVAGGGYTTEFILLSATGAASMTISYFGNTGTPLAIGR